MISVVFYHICSQVFEKSICFLISDLYKSKENIVIQLNNITLQESINRMLWTFDKKSFIPHGSDLDLKDVSYPVYLTVNNDFVNSPSILILVSLYDWVLANNNIISKIFIVFNNEANLPDIRQKYTDLKNQQQKFLLSYYKI